MSTDTVWKRALEAFEQVMELPAGVVDARLQEYDRKDPELGRQLRAMLRAHERSGDEAGFAPVQSALHEAVEGDQEESAFAPGQAIGPYRLLREIGRGGMAVVWLAERADGSLQRSVALKLPILALRTHAFTQRFIRERDILARLRHPHIARLYDAGLTSDGQPFLALEYIEGEPITRWCDSRQASLRQRIELFCQVLDAVQFAHANLIIHRDIKPGNILVDANGQVSLLDFGIARLLDTSSGDAEQTQLTQAGSRMLTLHYASPEQIRGEVLTTATDIWSLGVVLHELLAGARPYRLSIESPAQLEQAIVEGQRVALSRAAANGRSAALGLRTDAAMRRAMRGDLDAIIGMAMDKVPASRYATAQTMHDDLQRHLSGHPVRAQRASRMRAATRFMRRNASASALVGTLAIGLLATTVMALDTARRERAERERAEAVGEFLLGVFEQANPDENKGQPFTAQLLLEKGERGLSDGKARPAALQVDLTSLIGDLYWNIGEYARARELLQRAVSAGDGAGVPDRVRALSLVRLARTELASNAYDAAIGHARQAIGFAMSAGPAARREASQSRRIIAEAMIANGGADEALPVLHEAMTLDREAFGQASDAVAANWELFGLAYKELSRYEEAIESANHAIVAMTALNGREHSSVMNSLGVLSSALAHKGDAEGAIRTLRESADIAAKVFGPEHRETIVQKSNLYLAMNRNGQTAQALQGHLELVEIVRRGLADVRPEQLAYLQGALATEYRGLSRFEESEAAALEAIALWERLKQSDTSIELADPLWSLGVARLMLGRHGEAEATFKRTIAIAQARQAPSSQWLAMYRGYLATVFRHAQRPGDALAEIQATLAALGAAAEKPTPITVFLQATLSEAQLDSGMHEPALRTAEKALAMSRESAPPGSPGHRAPLFAWARALRANGFAEAAQAPLREALALSTPPLADNDPRVLELKVELVASLQAVQRSAEADAVRREVEPLLRATASTYMRSLAARMVYAQH